jgi:hypothetical protein
MSKSNESNNYYQGLTREQVLATMRQLVKEEGLNHFRMGQLYNYMRDSKLLQGTEYTNAVDFFTANIKEVSKSALLMYGSVAAAFGEEVCSRFGITCLKLLLTYKAAAKIELNHDEPGGTFILVPGENGEVKPKLFAECGVEDMRKALGRLRTGSTADPIPEEHVALAAQYREAVTGKFPKGTPIQVQVRSPEVKTVLDFKGIPVEKVEALTEALLDQLYPVHEVPAVEPQPQVM